MIVHLCCVNGRDANDGTEDNPVRTLVRACEILHEKIPADDLGWGYKFKTEGDYGPYPQVEIPKTADGQNRIPGFIGTPICVATVTIEHVYDNPIPKEILAQIPESTQMIRLLTGGFARLSSAADAPRDVCVRVVEDVDALPSELYVLLPSGEKRIVAWCAQRHVIFDAHGFEPKIGDRLELVRNMKIGMPVIGDTSVH